MKFYVLGPLAVIDGSTNVTPRAPKLQRLLGLLLMRHDQVVHFEELIDELWGERPPVSAASTLQTYVYKLRKTLLTGAGPDRRSVLRTRPHGYQMVVPPADLDLCRFEKLAEEGRTRLAEDDAHAATAALDTALSLWRGRPLAGMRTRTPLSVHVTRLEENRLDALEGRAEAGLRLGRHQELIADLEDLVARNPLHEGFAAKLMNALHMSGRTGDAVAAYRRLCTSFTEELGLEPSPYLQRVYRGLVLSSPRRQGRAAAPPASRLSSGPRPAPTAPWPPPDIPDLVGREDVTDSVARLLGRRDRPEGVTPIVSISGVPGVGKTALAVRLAHRLRRRFAGGVHFVSLRGSERCPAPPMEVYDRLLDFLAVPDGDRPGDPAEAGAAFRTWIEGRNALIVLDDVQDAERARLFLPGCPGSAVIVTSRRGLYGLAGAHVVELDPLGLADGLRLLGMTIGHARIEEERRDAERLVRLCEHLPLAVRGVAARLLASPGMSLRECADHLAATTRRLSELSYGDVNVGGRFDAGYRRLGETERALLCELTRARVTGFTTRRVSRLVGWSVSAAETAVIRLVEHRFVRVGGRDPSGELHYTFTPFADAYVWERVVGVCPAG